MYSLSFNKSFCVLSPSEILVNGPKRTQICLRTDSSPVHVSMRCQLDWWWTGFIVQNNRSIWTRQDCFWKLLRDTFEIIFKSPAECICLKCNLFLALNVLYTMLLNTLCTMLKLNELSLIWNKAIWFNNDDRTVQLNSLGLSEHLVH